jgi:prevent-host-death family protein
MAKEYSIYDAKAKLSALVRQVRETGQSFVITVHGEPLAEMRPFEQIAKPDTLAERVAALEAIGAISPSRLRPGERPTFPVGEPQPGALQRFLEERD